ncbi:MAG: hypothetical protein ACKO24_09865 [Leptolyngbyaceae cyanobacterium]
MASEVNQSNSEESGKVRKLFIPDVETELADSPKNDRPANLEDIADAPEQPGKIRKPVEIDELNEQDDPRSPKNTDRNS